jgi:hypothetical protein
MISANENGGTPTEPQSGGDGVMYAEDNLPRYRVIRGALINGKIQMKLTAAYDHPECPKYTFKPKTGYEGALQRQQLKQQMKMEKKDG